MFAIYIGNNTSSNESVIDFYTQYTSLNDSAKIEKNTSYFLLNIPINDDFRLENNEEIHIAVIPFEHEIPVEHGIPADSEIPDGHVICLTDVTIIDDDGT